MYSSGTSLCVTVSVSVHVCVCVVSVALAKGYALMYIHCQCALSDVHEPVSVAHRQMCGKHVCKSFVIVSVISGLPNDSKHTLFLWDTSTHRSFHMTGEMLGQANVIPL